MHIWLQHTVLNIKYMGFSIYALQYISLYFQRMHICNVNIHDIHGDITLEVGTHIIYYICMSLYGSMK